MEEIIKPILPSEWLSQQTKYFINPTGRFVIGGPMGDCGLTGRKIIVDTYGGAARHEMCIRDSLYWQQAQKEGRLIKQKRESHQQGILLHFYSKL